MTWGEIVTASEWVRAPIAVALATRRAAKREGATRWEVVVDGRVVRSGKV